MPRIVSWDEQLKYIRPNFDKYLKFMTPKAIEYVESSTSDEEMEAKIDILASELWFCEHMTNYVSDLIKIELESVKEDP